MLSDDRFDHRVDPADIGRQIVHLVRRALDFDRRPDHHFELRAIALPDVERGKDRGTGHSRQPGGIKAKAVLENVAYGDSAYACAEGADALVITTEWEQFWAST